MFLVTTATMFLMQFPHPTMDEVELMLLGRLNRAEAQQVGSHLLRCADCRRIDANLKKQINLIQTVLVQTRRDGLDLRCDVCRRSQAARSAAQISGAVAGL